MDFGKEIYAKTETFLVWSCSLRKKHGELQEELFLTYTYAELIVLSAICAIQQCRESVGNSEPWTAP